MEYAGFLFFLTITVRYIWNGKDFFSKADWLNFGLRCLGVAAGMLVTGFIIKGALAFFPGFTKSTAKFILVTLSLSSIMVLGIKFLIVKLCAIFDHIMGFHRDYNQSNYQRLHVIKQNGTLPLLFLKCLLSAVSAIIFYGIWLGQ